MLDFWQILIILPLTCWTVFALGALMWVLFRSKLKPGDENQNDDLEGKIRLDLDKSKNESFDSRNVPKNPSNVFEANITRPDLTNDNDKTTVFKIDPTDTVNSELSQLNCMVNFEFFCSTLFKKLFDVKY